MSALNNFLQAQGSYKPIISKDVFNIERVARSGFAKEHNSFAVHGKLQDYEVDLEPVIVQKERYYNPPSKHLDIHWGLKNEPDGLFVNAGYPAKETNTFLRTPEALRLTHKQRKPRDPIKESGMFYFTGNTLPNRVEQDAFSIDTVSQRTIRDQVYSDGVPRSGLGMDIALASEQSKMQNSQNDKLFEIMQAIIQSSGDNKRVADILESKMPRPPSKEEEMPTLPPVKETLQKAIEAKFDDLLKQRPSEIIAQIQDAQRKAQEVQNDYEQKGQDIPTEFLTFAQKLQGFQEEAFSTKWGEKRRIKRSELMPENKDAIKALASILVTEEGLPVFEEVKTPESSRRSSMSGMPPSEAVSLSSSQKEAKITEQLIRGLPKVPTKFQVGNNMYIMERNILSKVMPDNTVKPLGGISLEVLKKFGGDLNKVVNAIDRSTKGLNEISRKKAKDDEASTYRDWDTMKSSKLPDFDLKTDITAPQYTREIVNDSSILLQKIADYKYFTKADIEPIRGLMGLDESHFTDLISGNDQQLLNTLNKRQSALGKLKEYLENVYRKNANAEWEADLTPIVRAVPRKASIESTASTINEDFENLDELKLDEKATPEQIQKALEEQNKPKPPVKLSVKPKTAPSSPEAAKPKTPEAAKSKTPEAAKSKTPEAAKSKSPTSSPEAKTPEAKAPTSPVTFSKAAIIQDFNMNNEYENDNIATVLEKVNQLDGDSIKRLLTSMNKFYADKNNTTQSINKYFVITLLKLREDGIELPNIDNLRLGYNYIKERREKSDSGIKYENIYSKMGIKK